LVHHLFGRKIAASPVRIRPEKMGFNKRLSMFFIRAGARGRGYIKVKITNG
jgi:hypothetical protein